MCVCVLASYKSYLVSCLSLTNEDQCIRGDDGQAEVDENDGAFGADVPSGEERNSTQENLQPPHNDSSKQQMS